MVTWSRLAFAPAADVARCWSFAPTADVAARGFVDVAIEVRVVSDGPPWANVREPTRIGKWGGGVAC